MRPSLVIVWPCKVIDVVCVSISSVTDHVNHGICMYGGGLVTVLMGLTAVGGMERGLEIGSPNVQVFIPLSQAAGYSAGKST